jgi:hypothetical protein
MQKQLNTLQNNNHTMAVMGSQLMTTARVDTVWTRELEFNNMEPTPMSRDNSKIRLGFTQATTAMAAYRATTNATTLRGQSNHMDTGKVRLDWKSICLRYPWDNFLDNRKILQHQELQGDRNHHEPRNWRRTR